MRPDSRADTPFNSDPEQDIHALPARLSQAISARSPGIEGAAAGLDPQSAEQPTGPVNSFTVGSMIATPAGAIPVELLEPGDRVITRDNGMRTVSDTERRNLPMDVVSSIPALMPVLVPKGTIGRGLPSSDILIGPHQRLLIANDWGVTLFGERETLVEAQQLIGFGAIDRVAPFDGVTYFNLLFEQREIVLVDGLWIETLSNSD